MVPISILAVTIFTGIVAILVAFIFFRLVMKADEGNAQMKKVSKLIEEGAKSFLSIQYRVLTVFVVIMGIIIALSELLAQFSPSGSGLVSLAVVVAISFAIGAFSSMIAGYVGMFVATRANRRTAAAAAVGGVNPAFRVSFRAGSVMGLIISGLALIGIAGLYLAWNVLFFWLPPVALWEIIAGFSFGASSIALFARAGGGIYTKTADVAADVVGKIEQNIPEDDPRNPATIADAVGDNVGDVAGTGADIFDSNIAAILAAAILGAGIDAILISNGIYTLIPYGMIPLIIATLGSIASVIGVFGVRTHDYCDANCSLNHGTYLATGLFGILVVVVLVLLQLPIVIPISGVLGLLAGVLIGFVSDVFTSDYGAGCIQPVQSMVRASETSPATLVLSGYSYGLLSTIPSIIGIVVALVASFYLGVLIPIPGPIGFWYGGVFSVAIAAVGLLATNGLVVSSDAYGPIVDNARGIIEQAGSSKEAIEACDRLDALGNTTKAITKGFAIGATGFTVIALFAAYVELAANLTGGAIFIDLLNPVVLAGALIGGMLPAAFSATLILGVQKNADKLIHEIRRQFREQPGILDGTKSPDYERGIKIATSGALRELLPATVIAILVTIVTGAILGLEALAAYLAGAVITGLILALFMDNAGGAWDNTKKFIESPEYDHEKPNYRDIHAAAITGDTIGDPFKDTAGPSINTLLTVISLTATLFLPLIFALNLGLSGLLSVLVP
ncbi:MAG: sodium-translocating pyrophosphatase [Candidatus Hodarchaeota archaeon]